MKKLLTAFLIVASAVLATSSCHKEYFSTIEELRQRANSIQEICDELNDNIQALQMIVNALNNTDMITGLTEIKEGGVVTSYKINFVNSPSITIHNGSNGLTPLVGTKTDSSDGNTYWTIQYGGGNTEWLMDEDGNKILAVGQLPVLRVMNGYWYYSYDNKSWAKLGQATGADGDTMFKSFDTSQLGYVIITLANGEELKIPTYSFYNALVTSAEKVNKNVEAQSNLLKAAIDRLCYITDVSPIMSGNDTIGTRISMIMSGGYSKTLSVYDWTTSQAPVIYAKMDKDGKHYWAYRFGDAEDQWLLTSEGNRIQAVGDGSIVPQVSIEQGEDSYWYWAVTYGDSTRLLRYKAGEGYVPRAVDTAADGFFRNVKDYTDSLVLILADSTKIVIPKQYSVVFIDKTGNEINALNMQQKAGGSDALISFYAYGKSCSHTLFPQGGFTAKDTTINERECIKITAPETFKDEGKLTAIFSFGDGSNITVIKELAIKPRRD